MGNCQAPNFKKGEGMGDQRIRRTLTRDVNGIWGVFFNIFMVGTIIGVAGWTDRTGLQVEK